MTQRDAILSLCSAMAAHQGVTHFAISMRIFRKGDFFKRIADGADCRTGTAKRVTDWFADNWPADLAWPADIPRPAPVKTGRAA